MTAAVMEPKRRKRRKAIWLIPLLGWMLLIAPVALFAGAGNPPCPGAGAATPNATTPPGGRAPGGMFAQPLKLQHGQWYEVGATEYGGPADPTAGSTGAIGIPGQSYLPAHPDTFAELSVLDTNPANGGSFTFADANALSTLPYLTGLVVAHSSDKRVLYKRDIGYGQGPGQFISNGQPYRLDVWWQSAQPLGVSKDPVQISLAPRLGAGQVLGQGPTPAEQLQAHCVQLAGQPVAPGTYVNPFRQSTSISPSRIDQGVDYSGTGPIEAIGAGTVTLATADDPGWGPYSCSGGHAGAVVYRLSGGPDRGKYIYLTEGIAPNVSAGQTIAAGQAIANFTGCIEIGWGSGSGDQPMAQVLGQACGSGDPGCVSTQCGSSMSQLIASVHGPAGIAQGPIQGSGC